MKTINEYIEGDFSFTEKTEGGESRMLIQAVCQQADQINQNNRIYPKNVLIKAASEFEKKIPKTSYGTADHSGSLKDTSHIVKRLWWNDQKLMGELLILNTVAGKAVREIVRAGGRPGISSRGKGDSKLISKNGKNISVIQPGFKFDSFDIVRDPSVRTARITKVLKEQSEQEQADLVEEVKRRAKKEGGFGSEVNRMRRGK